MLDPFKLCLTEYSNQPNILPLIHEGHFSIIYAIENIGVYAGYSHVFHLLL